MIWDTVLAIWTAYRMSASSTRRWTPPRRCRASGRPRRAPVRDRVCRGRPLHRLAVALEAHGMLRRDDDGRFDLGPELSALGRLADQRFPLVELARTCSTQLRDETGESVQLFVREGTQRRCVVSLPSPHALRWIVPEGARLPLDLGSAGRVLSGELGPRGWVEPASRSASRASRRSARPCGRRTATSSPRSASAAPSSGSRDGPATASAPRWSTPPPGSPCPDRSHPPCLCHRNRRSSPMSVTQTGVGCRRGAVEPDRPTLTV